MNIGQMRELKINDRMLDLSQTTTVILLNINDLNFSMERER